MASWLQGKVVLVTGGSGGIGQAAGRALAAAGARVVLAGRSEAALRAVDLGDGLAPAALLSLDVRDAAAWDRTIAAVVRQLGALDVLVHNAGIVDPGPLEAIPPDRLRALLETNLLGAMLGCRAALPALRASRGAIVHVASMGGLVPMPFEAAYAASKAGLRQFSLSLRAELAGTGVTVSLLTPDSVDTPQLEAELLHDEASLSFANPPLPADAVGAALLLAIRTGAPEVLVPPVGGFAARLAAAFPRLLLWSIPFLRRSGAKRMARLRAERARKKS